MGCYDDAMASTELLMKALDSAHFELGEAFKGLEDADVWKRPHPRLLSVGELAAHIAFWQAASFLGDDFENALTSPAARYYSANIKEPFALPMGAEQVLAALQQVHEACTSAWMAHPQDSDAPCPHRDGWTWGYTIEYQAFHIAYHTGQMYSVRHLLGHETADN